MDEQAVGPTIEHAVVPRCVEASVQAIFDGPMVDVGGQPLLRRKLRGGAAGQ